MLLKTDGLKLKRGIDKEFPPVNIQCNFLDIDFPCLYCVKMNTQLYVLFVRVWCCTKHKTKGHTYILVLFSPCKRKSLICLNSVQCLISAGNKWCLKCACLDFHLPGKYHCHGYLSLVTI